MEFGFWFPLSAEHNPCGVQEKGVYRVRAVVSPGIPKAIPRALAVDEEGIVYIGQGLLSARIGKLSWMGEKKAKHHHPLSSTWSFYELDRVCEHTLLEVQWKESDYPEKEESDLINEYKLKFGDIPVGNLETG